MSEETDDRPSWFNAELVKETLARHFRRRELIQLVGGIALRDVVDGIASVPPGWVMDSETCFFVPPGFEPNQGIH